MRQPSIIIGLVVALASLMVRPASAQSLNFTPFRSILRVSVGQGGSGPDNPNDAGLVTSISVEHWIADRVRVRVQGDAMRWSYDDGTSLGMTSASRAGAGVGLVRVFTGERPGTPSNSSDALMNLYAGAGLGWYHTKFHGPQSYQLNSAGVFVVAGMEIHQPVGRWGGFGEFQVSFRKSLPGFETSLLTSIEFAGTAGVKVRF